MSICIVGYGTSVTNCTQNRNETMTRITNAYKSNSKNINDSHDDYSDIINFYDRVTKATKIETRYVCPKAYDLEKKYNFQVPYFEKMKLWKEYAFQLAYKSCNESINDYIKNYNGEINDISHVIAHSTTGWSNPGITHYIIDKFNLSHNVRPIEANIAGCYAGSHLLYLATSIINMSSNAVVLIVDTEIMDAPCSYPQINFDAVSKNKSEYTGLTLFGTGSGSLIIKKISLQSACIGPLWEIKSETQKSHIIPNTMNDICLSWAGNKSNNITSNVFVLSSKVCKKFAEMVENKLGEWLKDIYGEFDFKKIDFAMHCGGKRLLDIVKKYIMNKYIVCSEKEENEILNASYDIYKHYGNQSGASIFFVLKELCKKTKKDNIFYLCVGIGITVQIGSLKRYNPNKMMLKWLWLLMVIGVVGICFLLWLFN